MGSKVGDYIHYHYINYLRFGNNNPKENKGSYIAPGQIMQDRKDDFIREIEDKKNKLENSISRQELEKYESIYSSILNPEEEKNENIKKALIAARKKAEEEALKRVANGATEGFERITSSGAAILSQKDIDKKSDVKAIRDKLTKTAKEASRKIKIEKAAAHKVSTVTNRLSSLHTILTQSKDLSNPTLAELKNKFNEIMKIISESSGTTLNYLTRIEKNGVSKFFPSNVEQALKKIHNGNFMNNSDDVITLINESADLLTSPSVGAANGVIGETVADLTELLVQLNILELKNGVTEDVMKAIQSYSPKKEGQKQQNYKTPKDMIASEYANLELFKVDGEDISIKGSFQKIDVTFKLGEEKTKKGVSVKNYNLQNNSYIHLVSASPLLTILLNTQDADFVNHYLNIAACHDKPLTSKMKKGQGEAPDSTSHSRHFAQANEVLKLLGLLVAIGGAGQENIAELFLINDNSKTGKNSVRIFSIYEIIEKISKQDKVGSALKFQVDGTALNSLTKKKLLENKWSGTNNTPDLNEARARITGLLMDAHKKKVTIAVNPNYFTKAMYGYDRYK